MKKIFQVCRQQAIEKGVVPGGRAMRLAVADCIEKERPGMAGMLRCRNEGLDKGLKPGEELKSYVRGCLKKNR